MKYVYLLQSISDPKHHYVGITDDLKERFKAHNEGRSKHTAKYRPWRQVMALRFEEDEKAIAFERYQKTGSGRAFANRHFW